MKNGRGEGLSKGERVRSKAEPKILRGKMGKEERLRRNEGNK